MQDRYAEKLRALTNAVLRSPAKTAPSLRQSAAAGQVSEDPELTALIDKIRRHAYKVTDEDIAALERRYSGDQLFELIVAAALGAGIERLGAGIRALEAS